MTDGIGVGELVARAADYEAAECPSARPLRRLWTGENPRGALRLRSQIRRIQSAFDGFEVGERVAGHIRVAFRVDNAVSKSKLTRIFHG
jgi:hypothetical protein